MFRELANQITSADFLTAVVAAILAISTALTVVWPMLQKDNLKDRMKAVAERREFLRRRNREEINREQDARLRREVNNGWIKDLVEKLQLQRLIEDPHVNDRLMQAGYRGPQAQQIFYFSRFALPFVFMLGAASYLFGANDMGFDGLQRLCLVIAAGGLGFYVPNLYVINVAQKRQDSIVKAFPDALDLLLICVEAGMSIEAALGKVAEEIAPNCPELAEEMALTNAELSYLQDRRSAYENLAKRTSNPGIKAVTTALVQTERYGTPLGSTLRVMAKENRDMRMATAEKKAAALPPKLTVPMILFFLPVLFVVILGPVIMRVQDMRQ